MTADDLSFKALSDFGIDDIAAEAEISQRMLRRLKDVDDEVSAGPRSPAARAALASSVVAHAVVELEMELLKLKRRQLAQRPDPAP